MSKIFLGIIVILIAITGVLYFQNQRLSSLNQAFELRDQEQRAAIETLQSDFQMQTQGLLNLQSKNQEIEAEMNRYLDIFKRHNLSKLAAQPVLPRELQLKAPYWYVVSDKNVDEFLKRVEKEEGRLVFVAMSVPDYELMAYNMQELKRYIKELKEVVVYYRMVTSGNKNEQ